jgi:hypothetical protein
MAKKPKVPTFNDIVELPYWARIAFAARCARRVQPIFSAAWPNAPQKWGTAVEQAISFAENAAGSGKANPTILIYFTFPNAYKAAEAAKTTKVTKAAKVAYAATYAALASSGSNEYAAELTAKVSQFAHNANHSTLQEMQRDFDKLKIESNREKWTDNTPVSRDFFGPLWLKGKEPGPFGGDTPLLKPLKKHTRLPAG